MSQNHAASILEVMSINKEEKTSKGGKAYTQYTLNCAIFQDDGEIRVGTHRMFGDGHNVPLDQAPSTGYKYPRYEPRTSWDSPNFQGEIVELVPVPQAKAMELAMRKYAQPAAAPSAPSAKP